MAKKKTNHKEAKPEIIEKPKAIDWNELGSMVEIIGITDKHLVPGKEYKVTKELAKILVEKKAAKLK